LISLSLSPLTKREGAGKLFLTSLFLSPLWQRGGFSNPRRLAETEHQDDVGHQSGNLFSGEFQKVGGAGDTGIIAANQLLAFHC